jgi:hypothetical protein
MPQRPDFRKLAAARLGTPEPIVSRVGALLGMTEAETSSFAMSAAGSSMLPPNRTRKTATRSTTMAARTTPVVAAIPLVATTPVVATPAAVPVRKVRTPRAVRRVVVPIEPTVTAMPVEDDRPGTPFPTISTFPTVSGPSPVGDLVERQAAVIAPVASAIGSDPASRSREEATAAFSAALATLVAVLGGPEGRPDDELERSRLRKFLQIGRIYLDNLAVRMK